MSYLLNSSNFKSNRKSDAERMGADIPEVTVNSFTGFDPKNIATTAASALNRGIKTEPSIALSLAGHTLLDGVGKALKYRYHIKEPEKAKEIKELWLKHTVDRFVKQRKRSFPDPRTTGTAIQIVDSVFSLIPQALAFGPVGTGVISGISETTGQVQEGKDLGTAAKLGATTGITNSLGVAMPAAVSSTKIPVSLLAQRVGTGVAGNIAVGAGHDAAKNNILSDAGYQDEANNFKWNDATSRGIDAVMGVAFGALHHHQVSKAARIKQKDAVLVANEARKVSESADPINQRAANEHVKAYSDALSAVENGDVVTARVDPDSFVKKHKFSDERAALDSSIGSNKYKKSDFIDEVGTQNPRMPAKKSAKIAQKMADDKNSLADELAANGIAEIDQINNIEPSIQDSNIKAPDKNPEVKPKSTGAESPKINNTADDFVQRFDSVESTAAKKIIMDKGDHDVFIETDVDAGAVRASKLMEDVDFDMQLASKSDEVINSAITCFISSGVS